MIPLHPPGPLISHDWRRYVEPSAEMAAAGAQEVGTQEEAWLGDLKQRIDEMVSTSSRLCYAHKMWPLLGLGGTIVP